MFKINYEGLKQRKSYDKSVQLIAKGGSKNSYPDRKATQIMNSPYMEKNIDKKRHNKYNSQYKNMGGYTQKE